MPFFVNCRYIKAKFDSCDAVHDVCRWPRVLWGSPSNQMLTPKHRKTPQEVFFRQWRKKMKRFREKGRGWRDGRKNIGETKNAINCEGQRVKGRSRNRGRRWRGETRNTDRENEIKKTETSGWCVSVWFLMNTKKKKVTRGAWERFIKVLLIHAY